MEVATFAAGCFWGVESLFSKIPGVTGTAVGYTGGQLDKPTYEQVCSGQTGHAEAIQIKFNPDEVSFSQLLTVFWECHNPTTLNRQGPDIGSQYRSGIFFHSDVQRSSAEASLQNISGNFSSPVVTEITAASEFFMAEDYHQQYIEKRESTVFGFKR